MEIGLISITESRQVELLGLERIATYLRKKDIAVNFSQLLIDLQKNINDETIMEFQNKIFRDIPESTNILGFTIHFPNAEVIFKLANALKKARNDIIIFVGSQFASSCYKFILNDCPDIDYVILGDGEQPVNSLIEAIYEQRDTKDIPGVVSKGNINAAHIKPKIDLTQFNFIDRDMLKNGHNLWRPHILSSEGCVGRCTFCQEGKWKGRNIEEVANEIIQFYEQFGNRNFFFVDSSFDGAGKAGKERIRNFCTRILEYPIRFSFECHLRADTFFDEDEELIMLMRKAGFTQVFIGIESGNQRDLMLYGKIAKVDDNNRTLRLFNKCDINVISGFIMFHPFSDINTIRENYYFLKDNAESQFLNYLKKLYIYYDSKLYHFFDKRGILKNYNYLKPEIYDFQDEYIQNIHLKVIPIIAKSKVPHYAIKCHQVSNTYFTFKALFPDEIQKYTKIHSKIKKNVALIAEEYFYNIFVICDIDKAIKKIELLEKNLNQVYNEAQNFRFRILSQKPFNKTFTKNMIEEI